jgi:hypothetical protein
MPAKKRVRSGFERTSAAQEPIELVLVLQLGKLGLNGLLDNKNQVNKQTKRTNGKQVSDQTKGGTSLRV